MLQQGMHMSTRLLNIYSATDDVEMLGKRLRRFPKLSAHWPCCKLLFSGNVSKGLCLALSRQRTPQEEIK